MSNFWQRLITGTLFTAGIIASIWYGPLSFQLLFFVAAIISLNEFYLLISNTQNHPNKVLGILLGTRTYIFISYSSFYLEHQQLLILLAPMGVLVFVAELYRKKEHPFGNIGYTLLGILYIILPFALLSTIAAHSILMLRRLAIGHCESSPRSSCSLLDLSRRNAVPWRSRHPGSPDASVCEFL